MADTAETETTRYGYQLVKTPDGILRRQPQFGMERVRCLLTSEGLTTPELIEEFLRLVDKQPEDVTVAFVANAADAEDGDKSWIDANKAPLEQLGCQIVNVDIKATQHGALREALSQADVIWVNGGNTFYLQKLAEESGLSGLVQELLESGKLYVGVSAGSILAGPDLATVMVESYDTNLYGAEHPPVGLGLTSIRVFAHHEGLWTPSRRIHTKTAY